MPRCGELLAIGSGGIVKLRMRRAMAETAAPDFRFEIRPILSKNCFSCHGPDEAHREADLRLDERDAAIEIGAIVPGTPDDSEVIRRITSEDPEERMPPAEDRAEIDGRGDRNDSGVDRRRSEVLKTLVVRATAAAAVAKSFAARVVSQCDRLLRTCAARSGRIDAGTGSGPLSAHSPVVARFDRPAADDRRSGCICSRRSARCLRTARRSTAGVARIRRALGPQVARPGPVRRHNRLRKGQHADRSGRFAIG